MIASVCHIRQTLNSLRSPEMFEPGGGWANLPESTVFGVNGGSRGEWGFAVVLVRLLSKQTLNLKIPSFSFSKLSAEEFVERSETDESQGEMGVCVSVSVSPGGGRGIVMEWTMCVRGIRSCGYFPDLEMSPSRASIHQPSFSSRPDSTDSMA